MFNAVSEDCKLHIICAVSDEEFTENAVESRAKVEVQPTPAHSSSIAEVRSKHDNLPSHARASALRAPTLCFVDELHVVLVNVTLQE